MSRARTAAMVVLLLATPMAGCLNELRDELRSAPAPRSLHGPSLPEALLLSSPHPNLTIEVDYVDGRQPTQAALEVLARTLRSVTEKDRISLLEPTRIEVPDAGGSKRWSVEELENLHLSTFDLAADSAVGNESDAFLHVLYVNGDIEAGEGQAVGLSLGTAIVIAKDWIDHAAYNFDGLGAPNPRPEYVERSVLVHEVGHSLGLVDNGIPMVQDHLDEDDPCRCHSDNPNSVMAAGVSNTETLLEMLQDNQWIPYKFDEHDLADIRAFQRAHAANPPPG